MTNYLEQFETKQPQPFIILALLFSIVETTILTLKRSKGQNISDSWQSTVSLNPY